MTSHSQVLEHPDVWIFMVRVLVIRADCWDAGTNNAVKTLDEPTATNRHELLQ